MIPHDLCGYLIFFSAGEYGGAADQGTDFELRLVLEKESYGRKKLQVVFVRSAIFYHKMETIISKNICDHRSTFSFLKNWWKRFGIFPLCYGGDNYQSWDAAKYRQRQNCNYCTVEKM